MPATKAEAARKLAEAHFALEKGLKRIFRLEGREEAAPAEPIKLLEVNLLTVPSGVMPLHFGPAPAGGIPFSSIIVEVTPEEFERIKAKQLSLPYGWVLGEELPKPKKKARKS
jgi:hypothetical protein